MTKFLVITGCSGVGKSTLANWICSSNPYFNLMTGSTTRPARISEEHGVHYFFRTPEEFAAAERFNHLQYNGFDYGYELSSVNQEAPLNVVVLDASSEDSASMMSKLTPNLVVYIAPPNISVLRRRMRERGDGIADVQKRLEIAREELKSKDNYDNIIVNNDLETAKQELLNLVRDYVG